MSFEIERKSKEYHGLSRTPTYRTWVAMRQRCYDPNHPAYPRYGGRGICVCERWLDSILAFVEDMGERPSGLTLERIDNEGDYSPQNCKWATAKEQANNTRKTRRVSVGGETKLASDVAEENGMTPNKIGHRIKNGWTLEEAVGIDEHYDPRAVTINGETMTMAQWSKRAGISRQAVSQRLQWGWPIEKALLAPRGTRHSINRRGPGLKPKAGAEPKAQTIAVRLEVEQLQKLDALVKATGWNQSEIIRQLIDSAMVRPPIIAASVSTKELEPA